MAAERSRKPTQRTTVKFRAVRPTTRPPESDEQPKESSDASDAPPAVERSSGHYSYVMPPEERRKRPKSR